MCQTVYHGQQVSHTVYPSSALLNRTQVRLAFFLFHDKLILPRDAL